MFGECKVIKKRVYFCYEKTRDGMILVGRNCGDDVSVGTNFTHIFKKPDIASSENNTIKLEFKRETCLEVIEIDPLFGAYSGPLPSGYSGGIHVRGNCGGLQRGEVIGDENTLVFVGSKNMP